MSKGYEFIDFAVKGDHYGSLVALEGNKEIPFEIKRVYYIYDTAPDAVRGKHAHIALEQVIICLAGSCDFILDNGVTKETIHLDKPNQGLYLRECIWREFTNFSPDCKIIVLASLPYDENDYIRNYDAFLERITNGLYS